MAELRHYDIIGTLGKGSYGVVQKIRRKTDGKIYVWKEIHYGGMNEKEKSQIVSEVNIMREMQHPFIVRYIDRIIDKRHTKLYIIMDFCENGDLGSLIRKCKRERTYLNEDFIWKVLAQLVLALRDCHRFRDGGSSGKHRPILHRDIKPANILLDTKNHIKLADFGLAKQLSSPSKQAKTNVGTPYYMSPEIINSQRYDEKSDIWAIGCLLYELAALSPPFEAANQVQLAVRINAGRFPRIPSKFSDDLFRAMQWMLHTDPAKRPRIEDLERLPRLGYPIRDNSLVVREYQFERQYSSRTRSLAQKEQAMVEREEAAKMVERRLEALEGELKARAREVQEKEGRLAKEVEELAKAREKEKERAEVVAAAVGVVGLGEKEGALVLGGGQEEPRHLSSQPFQAKDMKGLRRNHSTGQVITSHPNTDGAAAAAAATAATGPHHPAQSKPQGKRGLRHRPLSNHNLLREDKKAPHHHGGKVPVPPRGSSMTNIHAANNDSNTTAIAGTAAGGGGLGPGGPRPALIRRSLSSLVSNTADPSLFSNLHRHQPHRNDNNHKRRASAGTTGGGGGNVSNLHEGKENRGMGGMVVNGKQQGAGSAGSASTGGGGGNVLASVPKGGKRYSMGAIEEQGQGQEHGQGQGQQRLQPARPNEEATFDALEAGPATDLGGAVDGAITGAEPQLAM